MALIAPPKEYEPVFNENTGSYKDEQPWPGICFIIVPILFNSK